jgi:general secretion pathway protein E
MSEDIIQPLGDEMMPQSMIAEPESELLPELTDAVAENAPASKGRLPYSYASANGVMIEEGVLFYTSGLALKTLRELRRYMGRPLEMHELPVNEFKARLTKFYQSSDTEAKQAAEDMDADFDLTALAEDIDDGELLSGEGDAPVIRLINAILSQAVQEKASDIHVEPYEDRVSVRFRIDGVLKEVLSPKPALAPVLVSRLKVMARLDIAEKRVPQDGRITVKLAGHAVDLRVSTMPSAHGERVVLRILDQAAGAISLDKLNMPDQVLAHFKNALSKPHGIILVTGPTGSGKTTLTHANVTS